MNDNERSKRTQEALRRIGIAAVRVRLADGSSAWELIAERRLVTADADGLLIDLGPAGLLETYPVEGAK